MQESVFVPLGEHVLVYDGDLNTDLEVHHREASVDHVLIWLECYRLECSMANLLWHEDGATEHCGQDRQIVFQHVAIVVYDRDLVVRS